VDVEVVVEQHHQLWELRVRVIRVVLVGQPSLRLAEVLVQQAFQATATLVVMVFITTTALWWEVL
jgi:hypothetical protein